MIRMLTANTSEIDDPEVAVSEILEQLALSENLQKNAVGILTCYPECIESGVVQAVCDSLPFDVVGCTTFANGTGQDQGLTTLSISVLTSDSVHFAAACSTPLQDQDYLNPMDGAFNQAAAALPEKPAMAVAFVPLMQFFSSDVLMGALNQIVGDLPVFGTLSSDHTNDYSKSAVIYNGKCLPSSMAILLLSGQVSPRFFMISIPKQNIQQSALVTSSEGCLLRGVNDMPVIDYLETIGLCKGGDMGIIKVVPFVVNYNDGTPPVVYGIYRFLEDGSALFGGVTPPESTLSVGSMESADVLSTTTQLITSIVGESNAQGMLIFSCLCRGWALGVAPLEEMQVVSRIAGNVPYHMSYSGGEICPVYNERGQVFNRFHHYTCIVCVF